MKELSNAGEIIKALHRETGITQKSVAEKFGISYQAYGQYLKCEVKMDTFLKIVDALGYHVEILPGKTGLVGIKRQTCDDCMFKKLYDGKRVIDLYEETKGDLDLYGEIASDVEVKK